MATVVSKIFDLIQSGKERKHLLAREIYFRLQDKAEKIRFGMQILTRRMNMIGTEIKLKIEKNVDSQTILGDDYAQERIDLAVFLETYFYNINTKQYNECMDMFPPVMLIYKKFKDNQGVLHQEDIDELNRVSQEFANGMRNLSLSVQCELEKSKANII